MSKNKSKGLEAPDTAERKAISSAVLGVPSSYGVKFSLNVTSQKKRELLCKLEEWRKAREEKLSSSILAKQKQLKLPKPFSGAVVKNKPNETCININNTTQMHQERETVFERLYKSSMKIKKPAGNTFTAVGLSGHHHSRCKNQSPLPACISNEKIMVSNICSEAKETGIIRHTKKPNDIRIIEPSNNELLSSLTTNLACSQIKNLLEIKQDISLAKTSDACQTKDKAMAEVSKELSQNDLLIFENSTIEPCTLPESLNVNSYGKNSNQSVVTKFSKNAQEENHDSLILRNTKKTYETNVLTKTNNLPAFCHSENESSNIVKNMKETEKINSTLRRSASMLYPRQNRSDFVIRRAKSEDLKAFSQIFTHNSFKRKPAPGPEYREEPENGTVTGLVSYKILKNSKFETPKCLRQKLEDWLKINGHPLETYRHLCCFGISKDAAKCISDSGNSFDASSRNSPNDSNKENMSPPSAKEIGGGSRAKGDDDVEKWLNELYRLIVEVKYPADRCEEWLSAIRKKAGTKYCAKMRIYWECTAALDEAKGLSSEHLQSLSTKNKSADTSGDSLAELFDKMVIEQDNVPKPKLEKGLDPKNIFKSTVIKFSVQQKPSKECGKNVELSQYVATPVRRSSRIRTPSKTQVVSSLLSLNPKVRSNTTFKLNESLFDGE